MHHGIHKMNSIRTNVPKTEADLRQFVSAFWEQCGLAIKTDCIFETSQGKKTLDVCAFEGINTPGPLYLCHCLQGFGPVTENRIDEVAILVQETGADAAYLVSATGPVLEPADIQLTDQIHLLSWQEFQTHFAANWRRHQTEKVQPDAEALRNYCDPLEPYVSARLREEPDNFRQQYQALSEKHLPMGVLAHQWNLPNTLIQGQDIFEALDCPDAWSFMTKMAVILKKALNEFDNLFGQKWRA